MADDEAWKGDEPAPQFGSLWDMAFPFRPLSPEQKAELGLARQRELAQGNLRYETLRPYAANRTCIKCGCGKAWSSFVVADAQIAETGAHEAIRRECKRCEFVWYERTLEDA